VRTRLKETIHCLPAAGLLLVMGLVVESGFGQSPSPSPAQNAISVTAGPPPSTGEIFPLSEVRPGMKAVAWTVFTGTAPEPMDVEILGVLHGARGPKQDMILAQLHGAKPEYTGVVAGMSGSPVYIGNRLVGSLSYRIGQFSKDPIAGITPIDQMLEVRDLPLEDPGIRGPGSGIRSTAAVDSAQMTVTPMETPLVMSGFGSQAIQFWQKQMAGTGLETVAAGGMGGRSEKNGGAEDGAAAPLQPGSAVSAQLVRGDMEIAATCTVTYLDAKQLLACGHPILQAGPVSLPMTEAEVVATLASPLNAFKIVNTGTTIGAFTDDRNSAIRGVLGAKARMIPMHISVHGPGVDRKLNVEILDLPSLTSQAMAVVLLNGLTEDNESTAETSYHLSGSIDLEGHTTAPLDLWASASDAMPATLQLALQALDRFSRLYSNGTRQGAVRSIDIQVEAIPRRLQMDLVTARLISNNIVHAGDTVEVEATIRPWQQEERNVRIPVTLPARLGAGTIRLLVSDSGTLDRTLDQQRNPFRTADLDAVLAQASRQHAADRIYVSLLVPETQAGIEGQTLSSLPLSVSNALETQRSGQEVTLNGESAEVMGEARMDGILSGFQVLNVRIDPGGGLH
jgi:hypothetical protein